MQIVEILGGFAICFLAVGAIVWNERVIARRRRKGGYTDANNALGYIGMLAGMLACLGGIILISYGFAG